MNNVPVPLRTIVPETPPSSVIYRYDFSDDLADIYERVFNFSKKFN